MRDLWWNSYSGLEGDGGKEVRAEKGSSFRSFSLVFEFP